MIIAKYMKDGAKLDKAIANRKKEGRREYQKRFNTALYLLLSEIYEGGDLVKVARKYGLSFLVCDHRPRIGLTLSNEQQSNTYVQAIHEYLLKTATGR